MKAVLVLNAGSSSLKFALFAIEPELTSQAALSGQIDGIGATPHFSAKTAAGERFDEPVPTTSSSQRE
jgi:acetate kinase